MEPHIIKYQGVGVSMFETTDHNESENKKAEVLGGVSRLCAFSLAFPRQNSYCRAAWQDGTACARADGSLRLGVRSCFTAGLLREGDRQSALGGAWPGCFGLWGRADRVSFVGRADARLGGAFLLLSRRWGDEGV